jgi:hypothetical protein
LSSAEEKISCFVECAFYEYESNNEGCPFKKVKGNKGFNIKEILTLELDRPQEEEDIFESIYIKEYF